MRSFVALIVAGAVIGCGARSGLLGANADQSGGVAGATTTGGNAGVGGSGGVSAGGAGGGVGAVGGVGGVGGLGGAGGIAACATRGLEGIANIDGVTEHDELDPDLALSSDDGSKATLMFRWKPLAPIDPIGIPPAKLGHLDFAPWAETWPASLGQAWVAQSYGSGRTFALGDAPGDAHAYLFDDDGFTSGIPGLRFAPSAVPKGGPPSLELYSINKTQGCSSRAALPISWWATRRKFSETARSGWCDTPGHNPSAAGSSCVVTLRP